jgi:hypothetical protein
VNNGLLVLSFRLRYVSSALALEFFKNNFLRDLQSDETFLDLTQLERKGHKKVSNGRKRSWNVIQTVKNGERF